MDPSPVEPTKAAVPTTGITASTSPPRALKTHHPYAASLYDVPFMRPPEVIPDHVLSHEGGIVDASTRPDHHVLQDALVMPSSAADTSRTQFDRPTMQGRSHWERRLTNNKALPPHTALDPTPVATAFQGLGTPYSSQSPYTYGLSQPLAPTQRPPGSNTQNTLSGKRDRYLALDGAHDTYLPATSQQSRRKPARPPTQQPTSHLLALDGASAQPSRPHPSNNLNPNIDPALTSTTPKPTSNPPGPFTCHPCSQLPALTLPQLFPTQDEVLMHMHTQHNMPHSRLCCCGVCRFVFWDMEGDEAATGRGREWLRGGGFGEVGRVDGAGEKKSGGIVRTGDGTLGGGDVGGTAEHFAWPADTEQAAGQMGGDAAQLEGAFDEFVDFGAENGGPQFNLGDSSGRAGAGSAQDVQGWPDQPT
ncbi:hypothetical protein B0A48_16590 [Cryoendolithus antarcticus]|uniref:Uncharacterized protein n=1 Tax=Cryoendolithus antarcticus TaxID=1507870 RepID=A0A1V8SF21_9PEZI|nr:hypothetical protein B0A48_16590 [Cryoendolithus antarcticus]